jgi:TatD DNase family protein
VRLTDTHCHLYFNKFDDDRDEVIVRATEAGVTRILVPGITHETSLASVKLADAHPTVFAAIGIHPTDALTWTEDTPDKLRELAQNPHVVAIGETGLHLREKNDAPHGNCVEDLLSLLGDWVASLRSRMHSLASRPGVLHSFSGTSETAQRAIDLGFMVGVTGPVTFKNAHQRREVISSIAPEHLLIETDSPFLAPQPHRGRRNEPAYVSFVAEKVAELYAKTPAEIAEITSANAARLFSW